MRTPRQTLRSGSASAWSLKTTSRIRPTPARDSRALHAPRPRHPATAPRAHPPAPPSALRRPRAGPILVQRRHDDALVAAQALRGVLQRQPVLRHRGEDDIAVSPNFLRHATTGAQQRTTCGTSPSLRCAPCPATLLRLRSKPGRHAASTGARCVPARLPAGHLDAPCEQRSPMTDSAPGVPTRSMLFAWHDQRTYTYTRQAGAIFTLP